MTTKLDLDDIERKARAVIAATVRHSDSECGSAEESAASRSWMRTVEALRDTTTPEATLALIARVRELEVATIGMAAEVQFAAYRDQARIEHLERVARAATAFVDDQGKLAQGDFAGDLFDDLTRALEAAGR